jgi:hypothetical protein
MRQGDATFPQQFLDIAIAEGEAVVESPTVADDLRGKSMTLVWIDGR